MNFSSSDWQAHFTNLSINGLFEERKIISIAVETWILGKYAYHLDIEAVMHDLDDLIYVANVIICI